MEAPWTHFLLQAWKSLKTASWKHPGAIFCSKLENVWKWLPGSILDRFSAPSLKMLENGFLEASWRDFLPQAWKTLQTAPRKHPGAIFCSKLANAWKWLPGNTLERFSAPTLKMLENCFLEASWSDFLRPEMNENGLLEASWSYFWTWGQKCRKLSKYMLHVREPWSIKSDQNEK